MIDTKKKKPRGRPPKLDRDHAIRIAMHLFWQRGYDSVGIAELSDAMGIKPPSLYAAFGSKLGLLQKAVEAYETDDGRFVLEVATAANTLPQLVLDVLVEAAKAYTSDRHRRGCLVLDGGRNSNDQEAKSFLLLRRKAACDMLTVELARLGAIDPKKLADYILIAMTGLSGSARDGVGCEALTNAAKDFAKAVELD
ncbi:TetR/AcrR family transcriptional regulator (plasmid) [Acaryochloris sp. 'Moss Beach']|uniref:TetR/AcrR family transcriptional regulator n=1 Tax=Acaryochloris sp. 'Moss Beach' TaxID=2740837 RepID=UPI001F333387|nr:TetR/AcrR family transcriptional regulator [Acaryochloris sp. 'Moss Beach']UJB73255.1 TetR/AcrR family transcriptional regulator [Acaryochloris sp. 'Moss Beach']